MSQLKRTELRDQGNFALLRFAEEQVGFNPIPQPFQV
jgi:hypothetical protein